MGLQDTVATYSPQQTSHLKAEEEYARAMGQAQWNMRWSTAGGIGMGLVGYQAWSAFKVTAQPLSAHGRDPTGASGSVFGIQFRYSGSEEYKGYALSQDISDAKWDAKGNLTWSNFRPDTAHPLSNQQSTKHGITARDQAGRWELGHRPGSGVSSLNPVAQFNRFGQMMRTSAFGMGQNGSRAFLGSHSWSTIYEEGHSPQYQGIGNWFPAVGY